MNAAVTVHVMHRAALQRDWQLRWSSADGRRGFRVLGGDCIGGRGLDGFGQVPRMAGRERLELEAAAAAIRAVGVLIAAPTGAWAVVLRRSAQPSEAMTCEVSFNLVPTPGSTRFSEQDQVR
jgi:hypothetical protein